MTQLAIIFDKMVGLNTNIMHAFTIYMSIWLLSHKVIFVKTSSSVLWINDQMNKTITLANKVV
jgi:hypothetical protein